MARPSNSDLFTKLSANRDIEAGTEAAVSAAQAAYPDCTVLEASLDADSGTAEVTVGYAATDTAPARIIEVSVDATGAVVDADERPDTAPGAGHRHYGREHTKATESKAKKPKKG